MSEKQIGGFYTMTSCAIELAKHDRLSCWFKGFSWYVYNQTNEWYSAHNAQYPLTIRSGALMSASFQLSQLNTLWGLISLYGHDPTSIFDKENLSLADLAEPEVRIPHAKADRLWGYASEVIDDPCFGLKAGRVWHPSHAHALGYLWLATSSLKDGIERMVRYSHVLSERNDLRLEYGSDRVDIILSDTLRAPCQMDAWFALTLEWCRVNYGRDLKPLRVEFMHPAPACSDAYSELFSSEVLFDSDRDCVTLAVHDVERKLLTGNQLLAELNEKTVSRQLRELTEAGVIGKVETAIERRLAGGTQSDDEVAAVLNMSTRTLQRKLKEAGTTYRKTLEKVRHKLANEYLQDASLDLLEVAFLLGYSEYSSFSRAYRRWTGSSPREGRVNSN